MNPEIKAMWVAALRSGEYNQTTHVLNDDKGFCCLGVLCDLAVKNSIIEPPIETSTPGVLSYNGEVGILPESVRSWAEIYSKDPKLPIHRNYLSNLNDSSLWDFHRIADAIEKEL